MYIYVCIFGISGARPTTTAEHVLCVHNGHSDRHTHTHTYTHTHRDGISWRSINVKHLPRNFLSLFGSLARFIARL